jgi:hypothetical protein
MANVSNNTERLAQIRDVLPFGAQGEIARRLGVSRAIVAQTINGQRFGKRIQDGIFNYFLEWQAAQPAPVDLSEVDKALAVRQCKPATK